MDPTDRAAGPIWPFVKTAALAVEQALDLAEVGPEDVLVDAGCGDGQVCLAAARRGARAVGWDLDENLVQECRRKARAQGYETLCSFERRDALGCQSQSRGPSLYQSEPKGPGRWLPHGTTVLFLFATDEVLEELRARLQAVVREGVRVLTYNYNAPWLPEQASIRRGAVRLYAMPRGMPVNRSQEQEGGYAANNVLQSGLLEMD